MPEIFEVASKSYTVRNVTLKDLMSEDFGQFKFDWRPGLYEHIKGKGDNVDIDDYVHFNFRFFANKEAVHNMIKAMKAGKFQMNLNFNSEQEQTGKELL